MLTPKNIELFPANRGFDTLDCDDGNTYLWPLCDVHACTAMVCMGVSKLYCYPHGIEKGEFTENDMENRTPENYWCE